MLLFIKIFAAVPLFFCSTVCPNQNHHSALTAYSDQWNNLHFERTNTCCLDDHSTSWSSPYEYLKYTGIDLQTGQKVTEDSNNKKYATCWGGDISLWETVNSYGYTARGLGQEIYKDNDTRTIEKLVIPWLLLYTNQYRKENGLDTLLYDPCLLKAAAYHADYLFNESKKNHHFKLGHFQDSSSEWFKGNGPSDRALAAGCKKSCGENALYNNIFPIPAADFNYRKKLNLAAQKIARDMVFVQWHNSKGHRDNMLFKGYSSLGVSVAIGKHYSNDAYINDKGETILINDVNAISWIAFGVQVMAY